MSIALKTAARFSSLIISHCEARDTRVGAVAISTNDTIYIPAGISHGLSGTRFGGVLPLGARPEVVITSSTSNSVTSIKRRS